MNSNLAMCCGQGQQPKPGLEEGGQRRCPMGGRFEPRSGHAGADQWACHSCRRNVQAEDAETVCTQDRPAWLENRGVRDGVPETSSLEHPASSGQLAASPGALRWREFAVAFNQGRTRLKNFANPSATQWKQWVPHHRRYTRAAHPPVKKGMEGETGPSGSSSHKSESFHHQGHQT